MDVARVNDDRYADALAPLSAFCDLHGYRWRWKMTRDDQWHAKVQIIDPTKTEHRDKVRAWMGATGHVEMVTIERAVRDAIDLAQSKLDTEARTASGRI